MRARPLGAPGRIRRLRRRPTSSQADHVAFVLSGGGPLGALQVGALQALLERGIAPDLIVGTSVGAMNGAFIALDPTPAGAAQLRDVWSKLDSRSIFPGGRYRAMAKLAQRSSHCYSNSGLRAMIEEGLGPRRTFEEARIPLSIVATELATGEERLFTRGELLPPLLATTAMPGVYPPIEIDGRSYIDGGVVNNVPIAPAVAQGASTIYVLSTTGARQPPRALDRPLDYIMHAFSIARSQRMTIELPYLQERARLVVVPLPMLDFHVSFTSSKHALRLMGLGYASASTFLDESTERAAGA